VIHIFGRCGFVDDADMGGDDLPAPRRIAPMVCICRPTLPERIAIKASRLPRCRGHKLVITVCAVLRISPAGERAPKRGDGV